MEGEGNGQRQERRRRMGSMPQYPDWRATQPPERGRNRREGKAAGNIYGHSFVCYWRRFHLFPNERQTHAKQRRMRMEEGGRQGGRPHIAEEHATTVRNERFAFCFETPIDSSKIPCVKASEMSALHIPLQLPVESFFIENYPWLS